MDKIFSVYLAKKDSASEAYATLNLPVQPYELLDAMDRIRLKNGEKMYLEIDDYRECEYLAPFLDKCDLFELNVLAKRLSELSRTELTAFEGLLKIQIQDREGPMSMSDLLDLAYSTDCCHVVGEAWDDYHLGRFYCENGFVPEVDGISDKVFNLLHFEAIGKQMRINEGGVFTENGYVLQCDDLKQSPDGIKDPPTKPDYLMRLTLGAVDGQACVEVELPATEDELDAALGQLNVSCWDDVKICRYDGVLPELPEDALLGGVERLNTFAQTLQQLEQEGMLVKFKAVMTAIKCSDLDAACQLAAHLDEYLFEPEVSSNRGLALEELATICSWEDAEVLSQFVDLYRYGAELATREEGEIGPYGYVCRNNFEPLEDYAEQWEQAEHDGMTL